MLLQKTPRRVLSPFFLLFLFPIALLCYIYPHKLTPTLTLSQSAYLSPAQLPSPNLYNVWTTARETCPQWISAQQSVRSYLDAYVIGTQKGGTSELSKRLHKLGVRRNGLSMKKEWHFFNLLGENGVHGTPSSSLPFSAADIVDLRISHYLSGHPDMDIRAEKDIPIVDNSPMDKRVITYDSTVEYMHSDRSAFIAHLLTPHARIISMIREPIERAISQYNMIVRITNEKNDLKGSKELIATKEDFHQLVTKEVAALKTCGYDEKTASYNGTTSDLQLCVIRTAHENRLHVLRGLYSLHMQAWRDYFPDHRMLYILFKDTLADPEQMLSSICNFLCIKQFPQELLDDFKSTASNVSFGRATALYGKNGVQDNYGGEGEPQYMTEIMPETRAMLRKFYAASDQKLEWMLGRKPY